MTPSRNQWRDVWDQFRAHKGALAGAAVFFLIVVGVALGPFVGRIRPTYIDFTTLSAGPSWAHPLATDQLGRDLLARVMTGGRISIAVGLTAMVISIILGTFIGVVAGYFKSLDDPPGQRAQVNFLRRLQPYHFGIPCADWLRVVMNRIGPDQFASCFLAFVAERLPEAVGQIAIDGKTSLRSHDSGRG
ncbi:hypothetical protein [Mesorhizobium sp. NZP2077]|uniref:hypothetical protein n=1 Tax=Mesorhizobium sp. NZP2077 TaxID=2483404 RepID=UPI001FF03215|nr:hypothetical protein [Mesorhizobium sp. NZP2077]